MNYGLAIKQLRLKADETQNEFAFNIGISQGHLSAIENGYKKPTRSLLDRISEHLKIPLPVLFWTTLTIEDVPENKQETFKQLKQHVDSLILSFF